RFFKLSRGTIPTRPELPCDPISTTSVTPFETAPPTYYLRSTTMKHSSGITRSRFLAGVSSTVAFAAAEPVMAAGSVTIINTGANDSFALQALIKNRRYFESVGLTATTQNVSDGVKLMAAIVTGAADVAILTGFSQVFPAIENGASIKLIGSALLPVSFEMFTANPDI